MQNAILMMDVFKNVTFHLSGDVKTTTLSLLKKGGAKRSKFLCSSVSVNIVGDSCSDSDDNDVEEANEIWGVSNIHEDWVTQSFSVGKMLPFQPFLYAPDDQIFDGVTVYVDRSIKDVDKDRLWAMLTWHGGKMTSSDTCPCLTHVVTTSYLEDDNNNVHQVMPSWIPDCIKCGHRLDEDLYKASCFQLNNNSCIKKGLKRKIDFSEDDCEDFFSCISDTNSSYESASDGMDKSGKLVCTPPPPRPKKLKFDNRY